MNSTDLMHPLHLLGLERERAVGDKLLTAFGFFALGTLAGAAVGLLLAPKEGRQLRAQLRGKSSHLLFSGKQHIANGHAAAPPIDAEAFGVTS